MIGVVMNQQHATDEQINLLAFSPDSLAESDQKDLRAHIAHCGLCQEHLEAVQAFYADVEQRMQESPAAKDYELAEKLGARRAWLRLPLRALEKKSSESPIDTYAEIIQPMSVSRRIVRYAREHPVRFASATTGLAAALILAMLFLRPVTDTNPTYAKIKDGILYVYNQVGDVLWIKNVQGMPEVDSQSKDLIDAGGSARNLTVEDLDGDAKAELLVFGGTREDAFAADTLYCFRPDGQIHWRYGLTQGPVFGNQRYTGSVKWKITDVLVFRESKHAMQRIFAVANEDPFFPARVVEVDPQNGSEVQTYWHAGALIGPIVFDIDDDGKKELILAGINNAFNRACVVVLDPSRMNGCGPANPNFMPKGSEKASEKFYLLLPLTKLSELHPSGRYNSVRILQPGIARHLVVRTNEGTDDPATSGTMGGLIYVFGPKIRIQSVSADDSFIKAHNRAVSSGLIRETLDSSYWEELKNSILYWDGEKFVKEPVMNRRFLEGRNTR